MRSRAGCVLAVLALAVAGCTSRGRTVPPSPAAPPAPAPPRGPLSVFVEGLCPKLEVYGAGARSFLVYGTYGIDEVGFGVPRGARQAIAELRAGEPVPDAGLLAGLPAAGEGYAAGDLELSGAWPDAPALVLVEASRGRASGGALFERRRTPYVWEGTRWAAEGRFRYRASPGMRAPDLPETELCAPLGEGLHFSTYAAARLPSGDTLVAGRCEDDLRRARGGVRVASFLAGERGFRIGDAPASPLFDGIVNLDIVYRSRDEAYLYAYPPFGNGSAPAYLVRHDGRAFTPVALPFEGPVVAMTAAGDGSLWVAAGWRTLWRSMGGRWEEVHLPAPLLVDVPVRVRVLDVQAAAGSVWVHAAYPVELAGGDRRIGRGHVLYTTQKAGAPRFCDRRRPAAEALARHMPSLHGAEEALPDPEASAY